ncbi:1,4-dihydroxy-2-naphthoate octaprenyltransferase [Caldalkalibacillus thermarum TA2.A1]|uniref:1,4-dihydroxy-2-naphthoate octaprenyltransferase n=1 Tax=Caldalkalibacillus thermarum (strain TA2.A1) TaxID=986075 RepID=F5L5R2_CALTT|nr:1,4-dihydroxy-2-naphthoate polyprenyltransferase [Caldalkalibacillus thermarum]EGL83341.1 1,4-dihydroxy-2-naphthoate octaprenyltransferase [Caldalkalibacillus thermarum TA2.A1]QZT32851.1 1,4-dihydroxy-2-naphthoate polyprenyltransferase [Caldalkalibacillus thermarum TA2.A1]
MEPHIEHSKPTSFPPHRKDTPWQVWWNLLRPHTLTASFIPVLIGTALTLKVTSINWTLFAAMLIASILIQAATNMFNEYYDYQRGLDTKESVGIGGAIVREGVPPKVVLNLAIVLFAIAVLLGVYICLISSWWVALIGSISMAVGYLYTGGPYPLAYSPFGELAAGVFMGPVIILLAFYIQTGMVTLYSVLVSIPIAILVAAIMLANNIRDLDEDQAAGRRTLAILIGRKRAIQLLGAMFVFAYVWAVAMAVLTDASLWILLVLLSIPTALKAVRGFIGKTKPVEMMPAMKLTAQLHMRYGLLLSIALFL